MLSNRKCLLAALKHVALATEVARKKIAYEQIETQFVAGGKKEVQALSKVFSYDDEIGDSRKFAQLSHCLGCLS